MIARAKAAPGGRETPRTPRGGLRPQTEALATIHGLHERSLDAMYDAVLGYRTRRSAYMKRAEVTEQSATRDLAALTAADILGAHGTGRGRHYVAGPVLREIGERRRSARKPIHDPYPWMRPRLAEGRAGALG